MRIAFVFHKSPLQPPAGIDLIRLCSLVKGLRQRRIEAEIVAPVKRQAILAGNLPVLPLDALSESGRYAVAKTSYHSSIELINGYKGPVVSRIVRVVDQKRPRRDELQRRHLLDCQDRIQARTSFLVLNNHINARRWRRLYGCKIPIALIPNGCPAEIGPVRQNPYPPGRKILLFLGSLAAPRMKAILNETADKLAAVAEVHHVGADKTRLYGGSARTVFHPRIRVHGEIASGDIWPYVCHAHAGLALATGPHAFDNDITKVLYYLRGGLPVLTETPILQNDLIRKTGYGRIFVFGDGDDLVQKAIDLMANPPDGKDRVMAYMARTRSWPRRIEAYAALFKRMAAAGN